MGWIVELISDRTRQRTGLFYGHEWERFCERHGIRILYAPLPATLPGFIYRDTLVLDPALSPDERAHVAWHELGHRHVHVGDCRDWLRLMACGELCLSKFERQAEEFAERFPVWGE